MQAWRRGVSTASAETRSPARRAVRDLLPIVPWCYLVVLATLVLAPSVAHAFTLDDVAAKAEKLAGAAYQKPNTSLPKALKSLTYDQYRDIRFKPERALWRNRKLP